MLENIFPIIFSYLIGSIPFSFIVAKLRRVDLRKRVGNGQIGAAAVKRNCGLFPAILAGTGDFSKGTLAVFIAKKLVHQDWIIILSGLAVLFGHNWSIFLKFWGGKGGLVSMGVLFYLLTLPFLLTSLYLVTPFFIIKKKEIFRIPKTSFFNHLGYLSITIFSFIFNFSFTLAILPILCSLVIILKKNY